ncbi:MAG: bacillithiol biosynthesis cysteine-adding enzyme BshC [Deinococcales bacterium]
MTVIDPKALSPDAHPVKPFEMLYANGQLQEFYALGLNEKEKALHLERPVNRLALSEALNSYAQKLKAPKSVFKTLESLSHPQSRTVVTGQQVGLLLGPLFSLSKAVTAIKLAKAWHQEANPVVAVFWLASQDHDSAEIDHTYLLDLQENLHRLSWPLPADTVSGRIALKESWLHRLIQDIKELSSNPLHQTEVIELLQDAFRSSENIADFFAYLLYQLLGSEGLIILNPLDPALAVLFKDVLIQELKNPSASARAINDAAQRLKTYGFEAQLGRAEGASNLFIEEAGKRRLLRYEGKRFFSETKSYSLEELLNILEEDPSLITPAAGLRPICQDKLLPTAVTVVGPGELRYIAQLKGVYDHHQVAMPMIYPRMTVTVIEPPVKRIMEKYGLTIANISNLEKGKMALALELSEHGEAFELGQQGVEEGLEQMLNHIRHIDPTLERSVQKTQKHLSSILNKLKDKSAHALYRQNDILNSQIARLEQHLRPLNTPQERLVSPFSFFLKFGIKHMMTRLLSLSPEGHHLLYIDE